MNQRAEVEVEDAGGAGSVPVAPAFDPAAAFGSRSDAEAVRADYLRRLNRRVAGSGSGPGPEARG